MYGSQAPQGALLPPRWFGFRQSGRDDPRSPLVVIEGDHPIVEADRQVRRLELIAARLRQAFDVMAQVIAEQTRCPALKRRQTRDGLAVPLVQTLSKDDERIDRAILLDIIPELSSMHAQPMERIGRNERIATQRWMSVCAVQKQQMGQRSQSQAYVPGIEPRRQLLDERECDIARFG